MDVTLVSASNPQLMPMAPQSGGTPVTSTSAPATGTAVRKNSLNSTFQLISAASATVILEVTNEDATASGVNSNWITLATMSTSGAGTDGFASNAAWKWVRTRTTVATAVTKVIMGG